MTTQPMSTKLLVNNNFFFTFKNIKNNVHIFYCFFVGNNNVALAMHLMWMVNCKLDTCKFYFMNWIKLLWISSDMSCGIKIKVEINNYFSTCACHHNHLKFMVVKCFLLFFKITIFMFNLHGADLGGWIIWREQTFFSLEYYDGNCTSCWSPHQCFFHTWNNHLGLLLFFHHNSYDHHTHNSFLQKEQHWHNLSYFLIIVH